MHGRGNEEQIFIMRQSDVCSVCGCGESSLYDKVCMEELREVLQRYGVSCELMRAIRAMYQAGEACVKVNGMCGNGEARSA